MECEVWLMNENEKKNRISKRNCPICGNNKNNQVLWKTKEVLLDEISLPRDITVVACGNCGFCYSDTSATMEDYDAYYEKNNIYSGITAKKFIAIKKLLLLTDSILEKTDYILDMGFGRGEWLCELKKNGYINIYGMDVAKENVNILQDMGIKGDVAGVYTTVKERFKSKFDAIFLSGVLEHILFPKDAISNLADYLKENGKIVISVPNIELVGCGRCKPTRCFNHEHINYFSIMSLDRLMQEEGFSRIYLDNIEISSDTEIALVAVYEKGSIIQKTSIVDNISAVAIKNYLNEQKQEEEGFLIEQKLDSVKDSKIVLWGIGARMMNILASTKLQNLKCSLGK